MQMSTMEKDELVNNIRNAAVEVAAKRAAFVADPKPDRETKRKALRAARHAYHEKLEDFVEKIEAGLDVSYAEEEYGEARIEPTGLEEHEHFIASGEIPGVPESGDDIDKPLGTSLETASDTTVTE